MYVRFTVSGTTSCYAGQLFESEGKANVLKFEKFFKLIIDIELAFGC
jgi:hypothetical protein